MDSQPEKVPLGSARTPQDAVTLPVTPAGDAGPNAQPPADASYLHRTVPGQQKFAQAFLAGQAPGLQQRYAPNARTSDVEGWVEDDETVERLRRFREEFPYG